MPTVSSVLFALLAAAAFADEPTAPADATPPTATETAPAATTAPPAAESLPDLSAKAKRGLCEHPPGSARGSTAAGADQSFSGTFTIGTDGKVTGFEKRILFANQAWKDSTSEDGHHGSDCVNVWDVEGEVAEPTACKDCDLALHFSADLDFSRSTCPQRLEVDGSHFRAAYDLKKKADGTLEVFFSNSGKPLGEGLWNEQSFTYLSDHHCIWL